MPERPAILGTMVLTLKQFLAATSALPMAIPMAISMAIPMAKSLEMELEVEGTSRAVGMFSGLVFMHTSVNADTIQLWRSRTYGSSVPNRS